MKCIYCGGEADSRSGGDHLIPQALGRFHPDIKIKCVCTACDSQHGSSFERIVLKSGFLSFFRRILRITNRNSKRAKRKSNNPTLDRSGDIESLKFRISSTRTPDKPIYLGDDGYIHESDLIIVEKDGREVEKIYIPPTRNASDVCEFVHAKLFPVRGDNYRVFLSESYADAVINQLNTMGITAVSRGTEHQEEIDYNVSVTSLITENHIRFVCNIVVKAMVYMGYSIELLDPMIQYVHTGRHPDVFAIREKFRGSRFADMHHERLADFFHSFSWRISKDQIHIAAAIMATESAPGFCLEIIMSTGDDRSIVIPFGKVIAKYDATGMNGEFILEKGSTKFVI